MSTRQSHDNREEAFNYKTQNYTPGQTQFNNEVSTSESSILEDPQLPISPTNIRLGTPNKENKKNVQFWTPENSRDQGNSANRVYDPILITPRHQYSNPSPSRSFQEPKKESLPNPPLNPNGTYFSGTVENRKGGDFFGYYYTSSHNGEVPVRRTYPINESTTNPVLPQGIKQPQTMSYNQDMRHQDIYPTPIQQRETGGSIENQGNPRQGPCFNCKEYGHYSRDCPKVCGTQDTFIKKWYYSPQQDDILSRSSKTEAYPRHHYPPPQNPYYTKLPGFIHSKT